MKLTEQQLAQIFKQSNNAIIDSNIENLQSSSAASDKRLEIVEKIADNSTLSASYQVINQLPQWSKNLAKDITTSQTSGFTADFTTSIMNWFKPALATTALVTAMYFMVPQVDNTSTLNTVAKVASVPAPLFSGNFEKSTDNPTILSKPPKTTTKSDVIYAGGFG